MHLSELARELRPHLHLVSVTQPDPLLARHNVVAQAESTERARNVVVGLENDLGAGARIGVVVMSDARDTHRDAQVDPEGVTGSLVKRILIGAAIGLVVGAVLGALLGWIWSDVGGPIGAALGGAALLGAFGGIWGAFTKMGGSDAYRQTFVEPQVDGVVFVTFHSDDGEEARKVEQRLRDEPGVELVDV